VVIGQQPADLGQFLEMSLLFEELGKSAEIPGGESRTVFATVADITKLSHKTIYEGLEKLPQELTIVVTPGSFDG
jgi:hypothetical protein